MLIYILLQLLSPLRGHLKYIMLELTGKKRIAHGHCCPLAILLAPETFLVRDKPADQF